MLGEIFLRVLLLALMIVMLLDGFTRGWNVWMVLAMLFAASSFILLVQSDRTRPDKSGD